MVTFTPTNATDKAVTLKPPSAVDVLSVNAQNKVVALGAGKASLTLISGENPGITAA